MTITVALFGYPCLQMLAHIVLTLAYLCYVLSAQSNLFEDVHRNRAEVTAELLNLMAVCTLQQFTRGGEFNETQRLWISIVFITCLVLLILLTLTYAVYSLVRDCKAKRRDKELLDSKEKNY